MVMKTHPIIRAGGSKVVLGEKFIAVDTYRKAEKSITPNFTLKKPERENHTKSTGNRREDVVKTKA